MSTSRPLSAGSAKASSKSRATTRPPSSSFYVMLTGQVESAQFPSHVDNLYCRYVFTAGPDWEPIHGVNQGISQIAQKSPGDPDQVAIWNFPIDISFKSTNAFGWPRIALSVYGIDILGRDIVRGYGSMLCPTSTGEHSIYIHLYTPMSGSVWQRFMNWLSGTPPEFFDSKFVAQGDERAVTRVYCEGVVKVKMNVSTKDMEAFGYNVGFQE